MPIRSSKLSRSASRWAFQLSTSLGATLLAALIVQSLPHTTPDSPQPAPELTSGGKFAARVASARAYDGLDTMPLPHVDAPRVAPPSIMPVAFMTALPTDPAGLDTVLRQPVGDGPAAPREHAKSARLAHVPARAETRRTDAAAAGAGTRDGVPPEAAATDPSDDGLLHQVASRTRQVWNSTSATTRDAWTATTSASASLVSRLIP